MKALGEKGLIWFIDRAIRQAKTKKKAAAVELENLEGLREQLLKFTQNVESYVDIRLRDKEAELEQLIREQDGTNVKIAADQVALARAKTFAIVDSILFAIENWATDDSPAPDITLASQATLFPVIFEKVSSGDENYYLTEVPEAALEIVRRGRDFVRDFREREHISILDPAGWEVLQPLLHSWWTRDAIPLLYGQGYEGWELEESYSREQMTRWRTMDAARPLEFPLIFDGMELVKKYGDEIREETGLPEFSRTAMQTRLTAHD